MTQRNPDALQSYADRDIRRRSIDITMLFRRPTGTAYILPATVRHVPTEDENIGERVSPSLSLSFDEAEGLMDALWSAHVRPTEMPQSTAGEIEAMKYAQATLTAEVNFLRTLVKHHLGIV